MKRTSWFHVKNIIRQTWTHPSNADHRVRSLGKTLGWQVEKRMRNVPRDQPFYGFVLRCYPDSQSASNVMYFTERYDPDEMGFMEAYLRPGDWFVDVGANIGTYSLLARSLVGPTGRVDGFEPHPVAAGRFEENVERNHLDNVFVYRAALASEEGMIEFLDAADVSNRVTTERDFDRRKVTVAAVRLDNALADGRYAMGKIDVEGFETTALTGASERLAAADPPIWQVEMLDHQLRKAGSSRRDLVELLDSYGYGLAELDDSAPKGTVRLRWADPAGRSTFNIWAVHRDSADQVAERLGAPISG